MSRQVQESEHVLADLLLNYVGVDLSCADGSYLTVTLEPAPVGKAPLAKVQQAVTALCERTSLIPVPRVDRRKDESDVRGILARCSALLDLSSADTLILVLRQDVWKCKECGAVTFVKDTTANEDWGCEHCSAGDKGTGTRKTTRQVDQPYIRGVRVREASAPDGFFGSAALPNAGRGAGDDEAPIVQEWAIKKDMDKFVPQPTAAALASPDGHDPSAYTSRERAGTTTFTGHPTEQFFNPKRTYFPTAQAKREWASLFNMSQDPAHPPADWTPWDKTNEGMFSLCTTPWNRDAGVDIETLDVAGGSLVDLLYTNHQNITSLFMKLMMDRKMLLLVQEGLLREEYFGSGEMPLGQTVKCPWQFILAVGYLEQILVAAQQSMFLTGKKDHDGEPGNFFQLYYAARDTVNIRVGFRFNNKRVQMSIIETAGDKYISVYGQD
eukprot:COSAG06_NODE_3174_length_5735_cov_17.475337_2_plen_439_part_00